MADPRPEPAICAADGRAWSGDGGHPPSLSEFRVLAMTRAARYPVDSLARRTPYARWRGALCTVLAVEAGWARLRLCRPDPMSVAALGAQCYERGVYEAWAPLPEVAEGHDVSVSYRL